MTLKRLLADGRLRPHLTSAKEIADLLRVIDRDMEDAAFEKLSADRRFATAYNAALQLATVILRAEGYRTSGAAHHWATFQALPGILGSDHTDRADYFDSCRTKRNIADYDAAGMISEAEVRELVEEAKAFRGDVLEWLRQKHPGLVG
ncbi:SAV_6107 family HEPN domain-containing protein [Candidatus Eisenbacteria bacterium]|uniref:SAV_6107 family HEPN domain-containing protein n=1 Tax=Eiseniibacteriota bacterium TaxID=2212470 RepID=A0ABV6YMI7_UNCEI